MFIFYTQYIGIKLTHYSLIILITKIFDGINDPIVGALIYRFTSKDSQDKFKPWIKWGGIILSFSAAVMFIDSSSWNYTARLLICTLSYILWDVCYTFVNVPYGSLNAVMTDDSKERTKLSTARSFGGLTGGSLIGFLIPIFAYGDQIVSGETKSIFLGERMFVIAVFLGVIAIISFYLTVKTWKNVSFMLP